MASVTIRFEGICTQVRLPQPDRHVYHRAVLVHGQHKVHKHKIPPHEAFLQIDQLDIEEVSQNIRDEGLHCLITQTDGNWRMNGARVFVENARAGVPEYHPSSNFYSLKKLTPDFGELSRKVVYGKHAACHFEVGSGVFDGEKTPRGSWFTRLRIETDGDAPILRIEDMNGGGSGTIRLKPDAMVVVKNTGGKRGDTKHDFLLHYLTADTMPADPQVPPDDDNTRPGNEGLGPGCSNSNYP